MIDQALFIAITDAAHAGAQVDVTVGVQTGGDVVVTLGVPHLQHLGMIAEDARKLADVLEAEDYLPFLAPMLREAAAFCDAHQPVRH